MKLPSLAEMARISRLLTPERVAELKTGVSEAAVLQEAVAEYLDAYDAYQEFRGRPLAPHSAEAEVRAEWTRHQAAEKAALEALRIAGRPVVARMRKADALHADDVWGSDL